MSPSCFVPGVAIALAAIGLHGCGGDDPEPVELDLQHVSQTGLGAVPPGQRVIRTAQEWQDFWSAHPRVIQPPMPAPAVDFSAFAVAGVFAGPKPRCSELRITRGSSLEGVVTLHHRTTTFGANTPSSCIGPDPFGPENLADMVLVPAATRQVEFVAE